MLALAARVAVPLLLFTIFLIFTYACQDRADRRDARPLDPPADDAAAPDSEPPEGLPLAA